MHSLKRAALAGAAIMAAWSIGARAQECPPPSQPPPPSSRPAHPGSPPPVPACVNEAKHTETCRHGEIARFNADVETFNQRINEFNKGAGAYIDALNLWVASVSAYSRCGVDKINASVPHR